MLKLHRHRISKPAEKIEFRFSNLRVSKVPKGWDKLFISLISHGKTLAKTGKAWASQGNCQWYEVFSECRSLPPKENADFVFKFVVHMESSSACSLGEATLNLTDHIASRDAVPVSLPLTVYSEGPILLLNVECVPTRSKITDGRLWKEKIKQLGSKISLADEADARSDESEVISSIKEASGSHRSSDSGDSFMGSVGPSEDGSKGGGTNRRPDRNGDPSKVLLEAAQETIEELRGEARLWERKARTQMAELEALKKEKKEQTRQREEAVKHLRDAQAEKNDLIIEIERLRSSVESVHQEGQIHRQKELEEELKFLKESNSRLSIQLKQTQESNIELVSILQELEEDLEKQKQEIASSSNELLEDRIADLRRENCDLKGRVQELERLEMKTKNSFDSKLLEFLGVALVDLNIASVCMEDTQERQEESKRTGREMEEQLKEKLELENSLREARSEVESLEEQIERIRQELGSNIQSLIGLLNASKESEDMLMADILRMKKQMEKMRSDEEILKKSADELQSKIKISDDQKQRLAEEIEDQKAQLTKIAPLEEEITALKSSLEESNIEKAKLARSLETISEECEKLKTEKLRENGSENDLQKMIESLRAELTSAAETIKTYKDQINRLLADKEHKNPSAAEAAPAAGRSDRLEIELKEMRERYLQMSLRYAEVEAQREDLVMKLKTSTKKEKNWFS